MVDNGILAAYAFSRLPLELSNVATERYLPMKTLLRLLPMLIAVSMLAPQAFSANKALAIPTTYYLPNVMPFGDIGNGTYQQVFDAGRFPGTITIRSISFAPQDFGLPGFFPGKYEITFSVTPKAVCDLDGNDLSQNIGSNSLLFFKGKVDGGVTIRGKAYTYDPTQGNLLVMVKVTGKPAPDLGVLQAAMMRGSDCDGSSRAYSFPQVPFMGADNVGLITIFVYSPVGAQATQKLTMPLKESNPRAPVAGDVRDGTVIE